MKLKTTLSSFVIVAIAAAPLSALAGASQAWYLKKKADIAAQAPASQSQGQKILDVAKANGQFNTFLKAVEAAGMRDELSKDGPFTVFIPTDDAFAKIPSKQLDALLKDTEKLKSVLGMHIIPKKKYGWDLRRDALPTLSGETVAVTQYTSEEDIRVNQADVVEANIPASNGIIHAIDEVLLPKS